jgi:Inhibitor of vertebrate lysozyme (Ivy)
MRRIVIVALTLLSGAASAEESPYLFDMLAKGPYRISWEKLMKEVQPTPDWLLRFSKDFDGVSGQLIQVSIDGKSYRLAFVCEPQRCAQRRFEVMFDESTKKAYGALSFDGEAPAFYGDPTPAMQAEMSKALKG